MMETQEAVLPRWASVVLVVGGVFYLLVSLSQIVAPAFFYETIGTFPPYNRHFIGDLGAFVLPYGLGLLVVARDPAGQRPLLGLLALGSILHALNHVYDDWLAGSDLQHWLTESIPLLVLALLLGLIYFRLHGRE